MRKIIVLSVAALFTVLVLTAANPSPTSAAAPVSYYVVHYGDTLDSISWRHGVSTWSLARANGLWNANYIYAGQVLYIPCNGCWYPPNPPCPWTGMCQGSRPAPMPIPDSRPRYYPYPMPHPNPMPHPIYRCLYQVRYGDSLSGIAWRFGTDVWTLARFNGIYDVNWIYAGQWLRVPGCSV
jgi:LysM repeat protein